MISKNTYNNSRNTKNNFNSDMFLVKKWILLTLTWILSLWSPSQANNNKITYEISETFDLDKKYEQKLLQIPNIEKLPPQIIGKTFDSIKYREKKLDILNIPESIRLPLQSVYINLNNNINIITKFRNIHYLPNVDFAYQLSLIHHEMNSKYWENTPLIPIILWLLSQETGIRNVVWDNWLSIWYWQLHKPTAKYLLTQSRNKEIFSKYFYVNKDWNIDFHWKTQIEKQENMIRTVYDILVLEKGYKKWNELVAIAKYNWSQSNLNRYARPVIGKAVNYTIFLSAMSQNRFWYEQGLLNIEHIIQEEVEKTDKNMEIFRDIFNKQVSETYLWRQNPKWHYNRDNNIEKQIPSLKYGSFSHVSFDQRFVGNPYIIPEKDKTIFSYFRENTREALEHHNNIAKNDKDKIDVFYYELIEGKRTKKIINTKEEMIEKYENWFMIYASPHKKKIYIDDKNNLYHYNWTEDRVTTIYIEHLEEINSQKKD